MDIGIEMMVKDEPVVFSEVFRDDQFPEEIPRFEQQETLINPENEFFSVNNFKEEELDIEFQSEECLSNKFVNGKKKKKKKSEEQTKEILTYNSCEIDTSKNSFNYLSTNESKTSKLECKNTGKDLCIKILLKCEGKAVALNLEGDFAFLTLEDLKRVTANYLGEPLESSADRYDVFKFDTDFQEWVILRNTSSLRNLDRLDFREVNLLPLEAECKKRILFTLDGKASAVEVKSYISLEDLIKLASKIFNISEKIELYIFNEDFNKTVLLAHPNQIRNKQTIEIRRKNESSLIAETNSTCSSQEGTWSVNFKLPSFGPATKMLENGEIPKKLELSMILKAIFQKVTSLHGILYPTSTDYGNITKSLLNQYPKLYFKNGYQMTFERWKKSIAQNFRNERDRMESSTLPEELFKQLRGKKRLLSSDKEVKKFPNKDEDLRSLRFHLKENEEFCDESLKGCKPKVEVRTLQLPMMSRINSSDVEKDSTDRCISGVGENSTNFFDESQSLAVGSDIIQSECSLADIESSLILGTSFNAESISVDMGKNATYVKSNSASYASENGKWPNNFKLPSFGITSKKMENGDRLRKHEHSTILKAIFHEVVIVNKILYPSRSDYDAITTTLLNQYPKLYLKDGYHLTFGRWKRSICQHFRNERDRMSSTTFPNVLLKQLRGKKKLSLSNDDVNKNEHLVNLNENKTNYYCQIGVWSLDFKLPSFELTSNKLENGKSLKKLEQSNILKRIFQEVVNNHGILYPSSSDYDRITRALLNQYPKLHLKEGYPRTFERWKKSITQHFRNERDRIDSSSLPVALLRQLRAKKRMLPTIDVINKPVFEEKTENNHMEMSKTLQPPITACSKLPFAIEGGIWSLNFKLPSLELASNRIENGETLRKYEQSTILKAIFQEVVHVHGVLYPSHSDYENITVALLNRFPKLYLKDGYQMTFKRWKRSIAQNFRNERDRIDVSSLPDDLSKKLQNRKRKSTLKAETEKSGSENEDTLWDLKYYIPERTEVNR